MIYNTNLLPSNFTEKTYYIYFFSSNFTITFSSHCVNQLSPFNITHGLQYSLLCTYYHVLLCCVRQQATKLTESGQIQQNVCFFLPSLIQNLDKKKIIYIFLHTFKSCVNIKVIHLFLVRKFTSVLPHFHE